MIDRSKLRPSMAGRRLALTLLLALTALGCSNRSNDGPTAAEGSAQDAEANDLTFDCLRDKGFEVTRSADGAISYRSIGDDSDYQRAQKACDQELVEAGLVEATTPGELRKEYRGMQAVAACLERAGVPYVSHLGSEEAYVEAEGQVEGINFLGDDGLQRAERACPEEMGVIGGTGS